MRIFKSRLARSLVALAALVLLGVAGYVWIEGWPLLDAAYMTIVTFTTVGYEEVRPLSPAGRVFNLFMMVAGVGVMLYILTSLVNMVVAHEIVGALVRRHRMRTRMGRLRGHFIVCGFGRVGRAVALTLHEKGRQLIVLDKDAAALAEAEEHGLLCLQGDPTRDADLLSAHVGDAAGIIAAAGDDSENVYIILAARSLNPGLHVVARASRLEAEEKLRRAGADRVLSPYAIGGRQMALSAIEIAE